MQENIVTTNGFERKSQKIHPQKIKFPKQKYIGISNVKLLPNELQNYFSQYISKGLKRKLEQNFSDFKNNPENPLIITMLQYREESERIYLIAKDPNESICYGIMEGKFINEKKIKPIPISEIIALEFKEKSINSFRAKKYIENGIKESYKIISPHRYNS